MNNKIINRIIVGIIMLLFTNFGYSQQYNVSGTIVDEQNQPIEYATVGLIGNDNKITSGNVTDKEGKFIINTDTGSYVLSVSCIGFEQYKTTLTIDKDISLHHILLKSSTEILNEITVVGKRPLVRREVDRIVFDAQQLTPVSTNALDILKNTPGLLVSDDDAIQVVGKGNIIVLLNGRELKMSGKELSSYLRSYNSNDIESVEVMTVPPSKYSAEGNAGVINIILKKKIFDYIGGYFSDQHSASDYQSNDYSANLQYKQDKVSSFINISGGLGNREYKGNSTIYYNIENWENTYSREVSNEFINVRTGADIALPQQYTIGAHLGYMVFSPDLSENEKTNIFDNRNNLLTYFNGKDFCDRKMDRFNANIHVDKAFGKSEKTMSFDIDYMGHWVKDNEEYTTSGGRDFFYDNDLYRDVNVFSSKLDFDLPFEKIKVTTGAAFSHTKTNNDIIYNKKSITQDLNDIFSYKESIVAIYADIMFKINKMWTGKVGLRSEYSSTEGESKTTNIVSEGDEFNIFPTMYLKFQPNKNNVFNLSLTSRINRPSYSTVNPFIRYMDEYNIITGNPYLNPEKSYIAEVGYTFKNNLTFSVSYRYTDDIIGRVTNIDEKTKITTYIWSNYMKNQLALFNISYRFRKLSWMESYITNNIYNLKSKSDAPQTNLEYSKWAYLVFANNSFFFNKNKTLIGQISGQFQTSERTVDASTKNRYRINLGLKYSVLNEKLILGIQVQNLFSNDVHGIVYSNNIQKHYTEYTYRIFNISATYNFGVKLQSKKRPYSNSDIDSRL